MKRPAVKAFVLVVGVAVMLTAGCGPQEPPDLKKSRAIAAENIELRKELAQSSKEIEKLKDQHGKELDEQKNLDTVLEENKKLRDENARLKAQIEELRS